MSERALILCVDDEPVNLVILEELLQDNYELATARSGDGCMQQVGLQKPDLILLDVNMPDMNGLETCGRLKADPETAGIPIIFVSALASQEELMAGYEAGGDDYITKPFSEEILCKKIEIVLASQQRKQELKALSDRAVEALRNNLSTTEELGMVVEFLHRCQSASNLDELARNVFDCLRKFELDSSLLILGEAESRVWFSDDIDRPMERQILDSLRGQDRVVRFGTRLAINTDYSTILVRNLPTEAASIERVRELLAIMIEGLDTRIVAMRSQALLDERRRVLERVLDATRGYLREIDEQHRQQKTGSTRILAEMGTRLQKSLHQVDLNRQQLSKLKGIIESGVEQAEALHGEGIAVSERFQELVDDLTRALDEQV